MTLLFLKKHWFPLAVAAVLLTAIARKNLRINMSDTTTPEKPKKEVLEKYTDKVAAQPGASMLGIGPDAGSAGAVRLPEIDDATAVAFLKRFGQVAVAEQQKFGMPASVLLACAYVNSFAGQRDCATGAQNFLAVRCTAEWGGPVVTCSGVCFRKYNTAWESIRDFNVYHNKRDWYAALKKSARKDWRTWINGLAKHGASDVTNFEKEAVRVIQQYRLFELDEN